MKGTQTAGAGFIVWGNIDDSGPVVSNKGEEENFSNRTSNR